MVLITIGCFTGYTPTAESLKALTKHPQVIVYSFWFFVQSLRCFHRSVLSVLCSVFFSHSFSPFGPSFSGFSMAESLKSLTEHHQVIVHPIRSFVQSLWSFVQSFRLSLFVSFFRWTVRTSPLREGVRRST
jgi:hypothetical protein